jgi:hypothetical protein
MSRVGRRARQALWLGTVAAFLVIAVLAELKAQPAPGEDAAVLTADASLGEALRSGDKSGVRKLLSLQFTLADENGKLHERRDLLADSKGMAASSATDATVKIYGLVAAVTGRRKSASGADTAFLDIWAKQKRAWRALAIQEAATFSEAPPHAKHAAGAKDTPAGCTNPCETIPYRVRSGAEQDVVNAFQAIEKAGMAHDAAEWEKHVADEFVLYRSGQPPAPKSARIAAIERDKADNSGAAVGEIESMRLDVYGDGAAMITSEAVTDHSRPPYRAARIWVKRNGQWLLAISMQTDVQ